MVYLENISGNFSNKHHIKKYGSYVMLNRSWESFAPYSPQVVVEALPCDERFVVTRVFKTTSWGFLASAKKSNIKFYVIKSDKRPATVVAEDNYETYTKDARYYNSLAACPDPVSN